MKKHTKISNTKKFYCVLTFLLLLVWGVKATLPPFMAAFSGEATLSALELKSDGTNLLGNFTSGTERYTIEMDGIGNIAVSAVPTDVGAVIELVLNGERFTNHSLLTPGEGENVLAVEVTVGSLTKSYYVTITTPVIPVIDDFFTWDNATVYFVMTDRFYNGDTSNDESYYRHKNLNGNVATFHGGDIKGLTEKLDYLDDLGVNAIWITAPYEQIHGWVSGKDNKFPHYAFHGYYTQDWTYMDKNMGTIDEFRTFVDEAHNRGIRVIMDIVLNHTGYNTIEDMLTYDFGSTTVTEHGWKGNNNNWASNHDVTDYESSKWSNWWSGWVRAFDGKFGFGNPGSDDYTQSLSGLPDVMTELTNSVSIPPFLKKKWQMESGNTQWMLPSAANLRSDNLGSPADYIIKWLAAWVREFGIDGFRCDTAKHVGKNRWKELKNATAAALRAWRADNDKSSGSPAKQWTDEFWMTGEDWGHGLNLNSSYYSEGGFDSMINFSFNGSQGGTGGRTPTVSDWSTYANTLNGNSTNYNVLSYISSHDTGLYRPGDMKNLGTMLLLLPGGIQIFYGDETARPKAYQDCGDTDMMTRGDMNWDAVDGDVNTHWKKVGKFRRRNPAVGAGVQTDLGDNTYGRTYTNGSYGNAVAIKLNTSAGNSYTINVNGIFADGTKLQDGYNTNNTATVSGGKVTMPASGTVILLEKVSGSKPVANAPTVTANPSSSSFTSSVTVSLSVAPNTTIYYTTDGSTPSVTSNVYSSPLTFSETTTLKTYAEKDGKSSTKTFTYTKGSTPPIPTGKSLETKYYSTNPGGKVGTNKTINIAVSNGVSSSALSNWTANELIAQGVANDICQSFNGGHEYPLYDTYSLYAAWDDTYLYLGWQFVNVINEGVGDAAKPYQADIRQMLVFDLDPNKSFEGILEESGATIWDNDKYNTFSNGMDAVALFSSKPTNGTPGIFLPKADGNFSYDANYCKPFEKNAYGYADGLLPSITNIYGIKEYGYSPALLEGENGFTDLMSDHNKNNDTFYEMKLPLATLGISKSYIESNGIGVMHISTYGQSAIGSIPYDPTVYDNVNEPYSKDESSSKEKEDLDIFTYNMARIGKLSGSGSVVPTAPVVSTGLADGSSFNENTLSITLSVTGNGVTVAKYTTDGSEPSDTNGISYTNGQSIQVNTSAIAEGDYLVLKLYAKNESGTTTQTYKYKRQKVIVPEDNYTVYFKPTSGWSTPSLYAYNGEGETVEELLGEWSGKTMSATSGGWYSVSLPEKATSSTKVIFFSSNTNRHPADSEPGITLSFSGKTGWYDLSTKIWTTSNPDGPQKPVITFSPDGGNVKGSSTITVTVSDATSVSGTFGSRSLSLTTGSNNISVSSYLNENETKTLAVSATNSEGTSQISKSFTRDDSQVTLSADFNSLSIYQVMVSSFQDGASCGYGQGYGPSHHNGDLRGIINALDYIKGLGVNALWMTPVFDSTGGSGGTLLNSTGYFCTDYFNIDPKFGTKDDFRELVQKAHAKGLYVLLDGVFGHHGGNVKASPSGKYPSGSSNPVSYPGSLDFYKEVATYWINEYEVDGWRLDQCYQVSYTNQDKNYWKDIREAVEATCSARRAQGKEWGILGYMVGEDWDGNAATIQGRTYGGDGLRSAFDFPGRYALVNTIAKAESDAGGNDISTLAYIYKTPSEKGYSHSKGTYPNMFITNHDVWRFGNLIRSKYGYGKDNAAYWKRHKTAIAALAAYTGPVTLYYGDEIGDMAECWSGSQGSCGANVAGDNCARTNGQVSGFDSKQQDLRDWVAKVMKIRNEHPACWRGSNSIKKQSDGILANLKYDSQTGDKILFVLSNRTDGTFSVNIDCGGSLEDLITGETISGSTIKIDGLSARFFKVK